jgi:UDP-N-acetylmuramoylalanine--D-glutamate ligase
MNVAIIGFGVEGQSALHYWRDLGATVTVCDINDAVALPANTLSQLGPEHYLDNLGRFDLIVRSAGIHPEVITDKNPGIENKITTVINEFVRVSPTRNIIGITGTKGKGTTSTLTTRILEAAGYRVFLGGNIGKSPFDFLPELTPDDWVVLELSSHQLHDFKENIPLAVCLMMAGEHFLWHKSGDNYYNAKRNLFSHQTERDTAIYFADNELSHSIAAVSPGKKIPYYASPGAYVEDRKIRIDNQTICDVSEIKLLGVHNWQNVCAAATIVWQVAQVPEAIRNVATTFTGLSHRLEFVLEHNGIRYYNDSFASAPPSSVAAAEAVPGRKVLILGGFDRELPLEEMTAGLKEHSDGIRHLVLIGASATRLAAELDAAGIQNYQISDAHTMEEIVKVAQSFAQKGDAIVLSPGFPSFDMFKNFEERGLLFKKVVNTL